MVVENMKLRQKMSLPSSASNLFGSGLTGLGLKLWKRKKLALAFYFNLKGIHSQSRHNVWIICGYGAKRNSRQVHPFVGFLFVRVLQGQAGNELVQVERGVD